MKYNFAILIGLFLSISLSTFGQQVGETSFSIGISKTSSSEFKNHYDETLPIYLTLGGWKSWYSNDHRISLKKEAGLNLQIAPIDLSGGGLGGANHYTGNIISLFVNAALQARLRISNTLAFGVGPQAEVLLIGNSNLNNEYYSMIYKPPTAGNKNMGGFNRDYFNKPSFGIKASLFESNPDSRVNVGLNLSYLWTKSEFSNFYAERYTRFSMVIGFKKQKEIAPEDSDQ